MIDARCRATVVSLRVMVAAWAIVTLLIFATAVWFDRGMIVSRAQEAAHYNLESLRQHAVKVFETLDLIAARVDDRIHGMSWEEIGAAGSLQREIGKIQEHYPQTAAIWLVDSSGVVRNINSALPAPISLRGQNRLDGLQEHGAGMVVGRLGDGIAFGVAHRLEARESGFPSFVVIMTSPRYFADIWRDTAPPGSDVSLLQADGLVLARSSPPAGGPMRLPAESPLARAIADAEQGSFRSAPDVDGVDRTYTFRKLAGRPVVLAYGVGAEAILQQWYKDMARYGLLSGLAACGIVLSGLAMLRRTRRDQLAWRRAIVREADKLATVELELHEVQKMKVIGQLAGGMAHDFGNVLTGIAMHLSAVLQRESEPRQRELAVRAALSGIDQGTKVVRSLLDLARRQPPKHETVDIGECLIAVEGLLRQCLRPLSELMLESQPGVWTIEVDAHHIELTLLNLAINARDAMPNGGTLRIATQNMRLRGEPAGLAGDYVALRVQDTGTGMEPPILERASEPFFTTKPVGEGTGLGLSQVFHFAKQSSGAVTLASEPGLGTTVTIFLPRSRQSKLASATSRSEAPYPVWQVVRADAPQRRGRDQWLHSPRGEPSLVRSADSRARVRCEASPRRVRGREPPAEGKT